ncbi:MAG: mechanosensitive ion channel family protein [Candidatus Izemoplasmatales bacterium]|nr:mechanosensitive ion channel family protein [Candidatus Izemoplasmatales bacterium]MDD5601512.1 mechanosensitive ion channel family protein [Candidatus Izemoplasmatales bacterium]MDY0372511.1 mechanosensitive ion channel family protein [Candidatus Izemoplasmatales bacterium]
MMFLFTAQPWVQYLLTVVIVILLIWLLVFQRKWTKRDNEQINRWQIVLIYLFDLIIFVGAIIGLMVIWNFDFSLFTSDFIGDFELFIKEKLGAIIGSIAVIVVMMAIQKVSRIALFRVGQKPGPMQKRKKTIAKVTMSIIKYLVGIMAIIIILALWGVNVVPALAGLGVAGLVIGLGAQKFINDLIAGFFIIFEHHFDVGDIVDIGGFKGEVLEIGLKTTRIRNWRGEINIISNGSISSMINFSRNPSIAIVDFSIAYDEDIEKTISLLKEELPKLRKEIEDLIEDPQVVGVVSLGASSVDLRVIAKTMTEKHYGVERLMRQRVKEILDANGIEIPFPQVVVHQANKAE